jgi:ring-1,2-phenylacetyl-CoA epoxidase subunit PaaB
MDTQWNRYEVFEQERTDLPYRNTGSVHAADDEMALEYARDVFVRRPNCLSLWVVPARAVFAKTMQEVANDDWFVEPLADAPNETYLVFQKQGQTARETFVAHVGQVTARSPQEALRVALKTFSAKNVFVWWVVAERVVIKSEAEDAASLFAPARDKKFRMHTYYPVEPIMRELKSAQEMLDNE